MTKGEKIKKCRIDSGLSQVEFASKVGISKQTLFKYENDIICNIPSDKIEAIARVANINPGYIMGWEEAQPEEQFKSYLKEYPDASSTVKIPVYAYVSAGTGCYAADNLDCYVDIPASMARYDEYFGLRVKGDSMEPDIKDNDIVIVKRQSYMENGKIVIAIVNGDEGFCKRLSMYADGICLSSNNPDYSPLYFSANEVENLPVRVIGIVKKLIRDVR